MPYKDPAMAKEHRRRYYRENKDRWKTPDGLWRNPYANNVERRREVARNWYHRNKEWVRERDKKKRQQRREKYQDGQCPICNKVTNLVRDHHHASGVEREHICPACNLVIGHAYESPEILRAAADYLEKHNGRC